MANDLRKTVYPKHPKSSIQATRVAWRLKSLISQEKERFTIGIEAGIELFPEVLPMAVQSTWRLTSRLPMSSGGSKLGGAGEAILGEVRESWVRMGVALVHGESRQIGKCMLA